MKLLRAKLRPPKIEPDLIKRPRLASRLDEVMGARMTLLVAPAGFGKSTLMVQWFNTLKAQGKHPCWLTIDRNLGEAVDVLTYLLAALHYSGQNDSALENLPHGGDFTSADYLLDILLETLENSSEYHYLFLDDFHLLGDDTVQYIGNFIEQTPDNARFIISSRVTPGLSCGRARALGDLLELDVQDLKFSQSETHEFFDLNQTDNFQGRDLETLMERTEGWVTGLKLANLAMRRGVPKEKLFGTIDGRDRTVTDYFSEELLSPQNSVIRDFIMKTCILERFCPELCSAVTEDNNAQEMINEVKSKGLFLFQLDEERNWYRYHHLFANFLQRQLEETSPGLGKELHLRASRWFRDEGYFPEAMEHALQSGDMAYAARLLDEKSDDITYSGNIRLVAKYSAQIPEAYINLYPRILLNLSWFHSRGMRFEMSGEILSIAAGRIEELAQESLLAEEQIRELRYLLLHRKMLLASARDEVIELESLCRRLLDEYPEMTHPYTLGTTYGNLLLSRREKYQLNDLEELWLTTRGVESRAPYAFLVPVLRADMGSSLLFAGKTDAARLALEEGLDKAIEYAGEKSAIGALPALPLAELAYENNDLQKAEKIIEEYMPSISKMGFLDQLMPGVLTQARLHRVRSRSAEAYRALEEGMVTALDRNLPRLRLALVSERIKYLVQDGDTREALRYAKANGIPCSDKMPLPRPGVTTRDEILAIAWVRIEMARRKIPNAIQVAKHWRAFCSKHGAIRSLIHWNLLYAQLFFLDGQEAEAQRPLRDALELASQRSLKRCFVDEGALVRTLLGNAYEMAPATSDPVDKFASELLLMFEEATGQAVQNVVDVEHNEGIHEELTKNELKVLSMASCGLRNREIAGKLGMTEGSIKWYMQQIYDKLDTRPRTRAIDKARKLGLIPS